MKKFFKLSLAVAMLTLAGTTLISCKKNFDEPPVPSDPNFTANTSIADLKALHTGNGTLDIVTSDIIIAGTVVADDKSGNLYKQLFIQDSTGGLQILLDAASLYATYPVGRKVYIKCNGLCISDYNGTMELGVKAVVAGLPSIQGIPTGSIDSYVVGGSLNNPVVPIPVTQSMLGTEMHDRYLGCLIQLNGYQFQDSTVTYSDTSAYKSTVNLNLKDCSGNTIILRTSAYANFAGTKVPGANGSIASIYTTFGATKQLILRDPSDINFTGDRCNIFEEYFDALVTANNNQEFTFAGWKNIAPNATAKYKNTVFGASGRAVKVTAFGTLVPLDTAWLITPPIVLPVGTTPQFSFQTSYQFAVGPSSLLPFISTDFDGGNNPNTATWTPLAFGSFPNIPGNSATNNSNTFSPFVSTGLRDLTPYTGQTVYIAFKYVGGTSPARTTNFEIDNIVITRH